MGGSTSAEQRRLPSKAMSAFMPAGRDGTSSVRAITVSQFNQLSQTAALDLVRPCFGVERWVNAVVVARPYRHLEDLFEVARDAAQPLTAAELAAAVAHRSSRTVWPPPTLLHHAGTAGIAGVVARQLLSDAHRYTEQFSRPFLVREAGRSPREILAKLQIRLANSPEAESRAVAHELRQIALLALAHRISI